MHGWPLLLGSLGVICLVKLGFDIKDGSFFYKGVRIDRESSPRLFRFGTGISFMIGMLCLALAVLESRR